MFGGFFGRTTLSEEEIESAIRGLDNDISLQVLMISRLSEQTKSYMRRLTEQGYFHGYVFGIGARAGERACDLFNIKESSWEEQKYRVVARLFFRVFEGEAGAAMNLCLFFAERGSPEFNQGKEDGKADVENVYSEGCFRRLLFRKAAIGDVRDED